MDGFRAALIGVGVLLIGTWARAQPPAPPPATPIPEVASFKTEAPAAVNESRILGVIPNYQTVSDPTAPFVPLTAKQKWSLALRENVDPFNIASAAFGASLAQADDETPNYGQGGAAYAKRFGAALGDFGTQNFFSAGLLASLFHQDPRYFRRGPESKVLTRVGYSLSRLVVARQDSGATAFNASGMLGMMMGIGASNLYYPSASRNSSVMLERLSTSLTGGVIGNLMSEFWPDIERFLYRKHVLRGWMVGQKHS